MRQLIVAGNWKMNGSKESIAALIKGIKDNVETTENVEWIVFPPYVYLNQVATALTGTPIALGAQNVSTFNDGAYTGEISTTMLYDLECRYVLLGHSERRHIMGENNQEVAEKFLRVKNAGLLPVLCVGETLEQRRAGATDDIVLQQLNTVVNMMGNVEGLKDAIVAYEPVWAIGTGESATPEQAQSVHGMIRTHIATIDAEVAASLPILYGGSVKAANAQSLFNMPDIDGGLIGGASLDANEFVEIGKCIKSS